MISVGTERLFNMKHVYTTNGTAGCMFFDKWIRDHRAGRARFVTRLNIAAAGAETKLGVLNTSRLVGAPGVSLEFKARPDQGFAATPACPTVEMHRMTEEITKQTALNL